MKKIGQVLSAKRKERNLSIEDVSSILKIRPQFIQLIEIDRHEEFSSQIYYIGFLKQYVRFLDLEHFSEENLKETPVEYSEIPHSFIDNFSPNLFTALAASVITVIIYLAASSILSKKGPNLIAQDFENRKTNLVRLTD